MPSFKLTSSKTVLNTPIFDVAHERAVGPRGVVIDRRIVKHPGAAVMVARNEQDEVLLIRQFRLPVRKWLWELPAGKVDPGETPLQAAKRELAEETGYRARRWRKLLAFYSTPGFCTEKMTAYLAEGLTLGEAAPEPYELIELKWVPTQQAITMTGEGKVGDAKSITALLYLDRLGAPSGRR